MLVGENEKMNNINNSIVKKLLYKINIIDILKPP